MISIAVSRCCDVWAGPGVMYNILFILPLLMVAPQNNWGNSEHEKLIKLHFSRQHNKLCYLQVLNKSTH